MKIEEEILKILRRGPQDGGVLSLYLKINPVLGENVRLDLERRMKDRIRDLEKQISPENTPQFKKDTAPLAAFFRSFVPAGLGLVVFSDDSQSFFWAKEFNIPFEDSAHWNPRPFILPLLEAEDENERFGVILADKKHARVFTYFLGEIEEEEDAFTPSSVRRFKSSSKDTLRSAFKLQRAAEVHVEWHLKHAAGLLQKLAKKHPFKRVILGGTEKITAELSGLLPPVMRKKIADRISAAPGIADAGLKKALDAAVRKMERNVEIRLVDELLRQNFHGRRHRVLGIDAVLLRLEKDKIHKLIYPESPAIPGSRCRGCGHLYSQARMMCGRCGSPVESVPDFMDELARKVVLKGGEIEQVRGEAAGRLMKAGGIGAIVTV